jgi:hypothetical protein
MGTFVWFEIARLNLMISDYAMFDSKLKLRKKKEN